MTFAGESDPFGHGSRPGCIEAMIKVYGAKALADEIPGKALRLQIDNPGPF